MENQTMQFCQSCGMPMGNPELKGTNSDGSVSEDYCLYCYKEGDFTMKGTMEEMIEACVPFVSKGEPWADEATARKAMMELFPNLKRWKK